MEIIGILEGILGLCVGGFHWPINWEKIIMVSKIIMIKHRNSRPRLTN